MRCTVNVKRNDDIEKSKTQNEMFWLKELMNYDEILTVANDVSVEEVSEPDVG